MSERASTTKPRSWGADRLLRRHPFAHLLRVRLVHHENGRTDKIPVESEGYNKRPISSFQVRFYSRRLYGFYPGSLKLVCVDVDRGGSEAVEAVCRILCADPVAIVPTHREGGYHVYFRWAGDDEVGNWSWSLPEGGGDLRCHRGWVVLWGNAADELVKGLERADQCRPVNDESLQSILPASTPSSMPSSMPSSKNASPATSEKGNVTEKIRCKDRIRKAPRNKMAHNVILAALKAVQEKRERHGWQEPYTVPNLEGYARRREEYQDLGDHELVALQTAALAREKPVLQGLADPGAHHRICPLAKPEAPGTAPGRRDPVQTCR